MSDDRLDSLMIIAAESDILQSVSTDTIINTFAMSSEELKKLLLATHMQAVAHFSGGYYALTTVTVTN